MKELVNPISTPTYDHEDPRRRRKFSAYFRNKFDMLSFFDLCMATSNKDTDAITVMTFVYPVFARWHGYNKREKFTRIKTALEGTIDSH